MDEKRFLELFEKVLDEKLFHLGKKTSYVSNKVEQGFSTIDGKINSIETDIRGFSKKLDERDERLQACIEMLKRI
ncbi:MULTISPECIES: hypothetical protein [Bacillus]|uniref:hypothetical protein n=1 Tax=Bacillus TaxID=1386 RepID=UPI0008A8E7EA|nr:MULTISPECIES: hypothetical protein [Bacillus]HDR3313303.1 hypothetical protein [Bacillus thuringiensis]MDA2021374.1 hypothetical protein [Bacillus cereus]MEC2942653.1 hypothetical protein [Bacillus cereus]MEC3177680.1 hypothetical protein [Bacillus cereus]MED1085488.1 hypothetical protein [Bacillus mycoides]